MKLAFSTNAFRNFSFEDAARAVSAAGYDGIEIMCDVPHAFPADLSTGDIRKIRETLLKNRLEISNLNAFMMCAIQDFHHPSWIETDAAFRQLRIQHTLDCIDLAAALGAKTISTEPGGPIEAGMTPETAMDLFIQGLAQVLPRAQDQGVRVLVEPEPDLLIQTSDEYLHFVAQFNPPCLGLNFDIGHFYCMGEDPAQVVKKLRDHTCHFHLEDIPKTREHLHILPGEGGIDIAGVLTEIRNTGYEGYITLELYPYLEKPDQAAMQAGRYVRNLLDP